MELFRAFCAVGRICTRTEILLDFSRDPTTSTILFLPTLTPTTRLVPVALDSVISSSLATVDNEGCHTLVRNWLHLSHALLIRRRTGVVWFIMSSFSRSSCFRFNDIGLAFAFAVLFHGCGHCSTCCVSIFTLWTADLRNQSPHSSQNRSQIITTRQVNFTRHQIGLFAHLQDALGRRYDSDIGLGRCQLWLRIRASHGGSIWRGSLARVVGEELCIAETTRDHKYLGKSTAIPKHIWHCIWPLR